MESITSGLTTSTLGEAKFKIHQSIPSGSLKRGPHAIVRSADLNDSIEIKRRFGEGSKPLFARDDIAVNQKTIDAREARSSHDYTYSCKSKSNRKSSSTQSSSPERYRHRESKKELSPNRRKSPERYTHNEKASHNRDKYGYNLKAYNTKTDKYKREKSISRSPSAVRKKPAEKIPYYRDSQREKDRLRRLYGYSRSRSPYSKRSSPVTKRRDKSPLKRTRSTSRERQRKNSPHRSCKRDYRSRRSRTPLRIHSPQRREYHKFSSRSSRDREKCHKEDSNSLATAIIPATPQYIPIPVAVPTDYASYSFHGWTAPQQPWHPSPHRPPSASHFAPFPMWPIIPPIRPPHQTPYVGMPPAIAYTPLTAQYRLQVPQRHPPPRHNTHNYQSRPKKPSS